MNLEFSTPLGTLRATSRGSGPVAVLWHSMFVDSRSWDRVTGTLARHCTLVLVDGPGSGRSDALAAHSDIGGCVDAAAVIVDGLRGRFDVDRVDWLGNAWGGHVGLHLAATRPDMVRSLIAISAPTFPIDRSLRQKIGMLLPLYRVFGARGPVRSAIDTAVFTDRTREADSEALAVLHDSLDTSGRAMIGAIRTAILSRTDLDWAAQAITCPTLLVATDDRGEWTLAQARAVADRMHDARATEIQGARIVPALERPAETASAISEFWSVVGAGDRECLRG